MTVKLYPLTLEKMWKGGIGADVGDVVVVALDGSYVYDDAHEFASDLTGQLGSPSAPMTTKAFTAGLFTADTPLVPGTSAGDHVQGFAFYVDTGVPGTSPLIGFDGEGPGGGAQDYTSDGSDIVCNLQSGNRVARI